MKGNKFTTVILIILSFVFVTILTVSTVSCAKKEEASEKLRVAVTILPLANFVENVAGEKVEVSVMVPPGANVHIYELTPSQMAALSKAVMYVKVGSGIEFELVWMDKLIAANKDMLVVDCSKGVELQEKVGEHGVEHKHGAMDPHIWMSPLNAKIMVRNICDGLVQIDPDNKVFYEQNRDAYLQKLAQLAQDIRDRLSGVANGRFMVYHPALGYFAREYNLTMIPIEVEGKEPTVAGLARLIEQAKEHDIKFIFADSQFNPQSAEVIAKAIGGSVVFINPLAEDYIANLCSLLAELVQAME